MCAHRAAGQDAKMEKVELNRPVVVIGSTRSGTSMLARTLAKAPGMALWYEPLPLWRVGAPYRSHDRFTAQDARPWVKRYIRHKFFQYQDAHQGCRIVEKTPTNVLRIPFVREILPEAKVIFILRDGRAMVRSQLECYDRFMAYTVGNPDVRRHIRERLGLVPWWQWGAYLPRALSEVIRRYVTKKSVGWFGVRYPGYPKDRRTMTRTQLVAKQWAISAEIALNDLEDAPGEVCLQVRYEDVVSNPHKWFQRMLEHCHIPIHEEYLEDVQNSVFQGSVQRWREELPVAILEEAMPILEPTLRRVGYL